MQIQWVQQQLPEHSIIAAKFRAEINLCGDSWVVSINLPRHMSRFRPHALISCNEQTWSYEDTTKHYCMTCQSNQTSFETKVVNNIELSTWYCELCENAVEDFVPQNNNKVQTLNLENVSCPLYGRIKKLAEDMLKVHMREKAFQYTNTIQKLFGNY
jgi:hypothetical protein